MAYYFNHPLFIIGFVLAISLMLALDMGIFNRKAHRVSMKEAILWTVAWVAVAMTFSLFILKFEGYQQFTDFQTAYWIEQTLSLDNLFVFILIFESFKVDPKYHHKVLFWGIFGAIILRGIFIFLGVKVIGLTYLPLSPLGGIFSNAGDINVLMTVFGVILIVAAYKAAFQKKTEKPKDFTNTMGAKAMRKVFRIVPYYQEGKFFIRKQGIKMGTQLLLVVGVLEFTDLLFAVDSIPAIFAITRDPFILYTSNIFAILGLRSLYFLLSNIFYLFHFLKYGLGVILGFIGIKMLIEPFFPISSETSLIVVGSVLIISILSSLIFKSSPK